MKSKIVFCVLLLMLVQAVASAATFTVPSRTYRTIQSGIDYVIAHPGYDTVEVKQGVYTGPGNINLDFHGAAITVRSQINPNSPDSGWNIINSTIIDCGGMPAGPAADGGAANRAFWFHSGEGAGSQVIGFTIKNGYARGPKGADGRFKDTFTIAGDTWLDPSNTQMPWRTQQGEGVDPCTWPPAAFDGDSASGDGYGGAIRCEGASSPTISYCVFEDCNATGAHGGTGEIGRSGPWDYYTWADFNWADGNTYQELLDTATLKNTNDGQTGGNGGNGTGIGYGGAIALTGSSSPTISNCHFINNSAQGGQGGAGGRGGNATSTDGGFTFTGGLEGGGGDAGDSDGNGVGGAIYAAQDCYPVIRKCHFEGDVAKTGPRGEAGGRGLGNVNATNDVRISAGHSSYVTAGDDPGIAGGAIYFAKDTLGNEKTLIDCNFINNMAYKAPRVEPAVGIEDIASYTSGGAIFCEGDNIVLINTCDFTGNKGGALYIGANCGLTINNDYAVSQGQSGRKNVFQSNEAPDISNYPFVTGSGGAIYIGAGAYNVDISNAIFSKNFAVANGGAIESLSSVILTDCEFSGNMVDRDEDSSNGYGGAIDVYLDPITLLTINATSCSFAGNQSIWGGAIFTAIFYGSFNNCYFINNTAQLGGALDFEYGTGLIVDSMFSGNRATDGYGGGIYCLYTSADINNCEFFNNSVEGSFASGGGIDIYGAASSHKIKNCLFVGNSSSDAGGAIACGSYVVPEILDCTFSQNTAAQFGGAVFVDWSSNPTIKDCIIQKSNNHAIHEEDAGGNATATYCLFFDNLGGHYYDSGTQLVYYDANINSIPGGSNNLVGDPLFLTGTLGEYYLSQVAAGQVINSPAVNTGSASALSIGLDTRTTAINDICDSGQVDRGYHYSKASDVPQFHLTTSVVGGIGTISVLPAPLPDGNYYAGTVVTVTVHPQADYVVKNWTGTDNDDSDGQTNTVTMTGNKNVTVELYTPRILYVGGSSGYPTIQAAIDDANDRDIIILMPSDQPYYTQRGYTIDGRNFTITSVNPDDPAVVASTVIEQQSYDGPRIVGPAFSFSNVGPLMRLQGITIRGFSVGGTQSLNGDPSQGYYDGIAGEIYTAQGIQCYNASPTIVNCVIDNCRTYGGNGGNGAVGNGSAIPAHPDGGNGGWPGAAWGGALLCYYNSNPTFINCTFSNNSAIGGDGGDGGAGSGPPNIGSGGRGGGWYYGYDIPSPWEIGISYLPDYGTLPKDFSGLGGAVYVGSDCTPTFESCTFTNNTSGGGLNGICGPTYLGNIDEPSMRYKIDNLGGAVYLAAGSSAYFNDCTFTTNIADTNRDPCSFDGFLGYGGAIAAENYATLIISNCRFSDNTGDVGGGIYTSLSYSEVNDCNFFDNTASHGVGLLFSDSVAYVTGSTFSGNIGIVSGSDGGAIALLGTNAEIADCNITNNRVGGSGGGIYLSGKNVDGSEIEGDNFALIRNCLITDNIAALDGGGISANWYSEPNIVNCTIFNNRVSGQGGGLFSSYSSYVNVLNSIIWDNQAGIGASGSQIAAGGGRIQVRYSDVQDSNDPCAWTNDINALDFVICFDTTGSMSHNIDAVKGAARQITSAIAARFASYRLALVDYRDYPDGTYGGTGDWAYLDRVRFTTSADELIAGLQPMVIGNGMDFPESAYTALMHCIDANALVARLTDNGYTDYIDTNSPGPGEWRQGKKVMRVILLLTDAPSHDPENYTNYVLNDIVTAANGRDPIHIIPVVVGGSEEAENAFSPVAVGTGGTLILAADANAVPGAVLDVIDLLSRAPAPIFVDIDSEINWDPNTFAWEPNSHNINADPLFLGGYFLSQIDAGQLINSPCWNTGSADVNSPDINLAGYTTRTDSVQDVGVVDMGYHYPVFTPPQYHLTIIAVDGLTSSDVTPADGNYVWFSKVPLHVNIAPPPGYQIVWEGTDNDDINDGNNSVRMTGDKTVTVGFGTNTCTLTVIVVGDRGGTVTPTSGTYLRGTAVNLTATPDAGYRIESWEGTNNDSLFTRTNIVTMNRDKTVRVTFSLPQTRTVPGDYTTIQEAIEAARSGDIVSVSSGVYRGTTLVLNKEITLSSTNPDDPCVVAATIIDSTGFARQAIVFGSGATGNTVLDGFTITGGTWYIVDAQNATAVGQNGPDGGGIAGGAIYVDTGASPTLRNCVIRDTTITGGNAGNGFNADATTPATRGGWGGWARGGGVYVAPFANPTLVNCTVTNCTVTGGNAGNGGNSSGTVYGAADYRDANYGGSYSNPYPSYQIPPQPWQELRNSNGQQYVGDYRFYSGYGGGVFCDANSEANFINCSITNNIARGGMSGAGGTRPQGIVSADPVTAYRIPSYGGGVYCGANSDINFVECVISGNITPRPDATYHTDPYLGHGGGIAFEDTAGIRFQNCTISDNNSAVGGGIFWSGGAPIVLDSEILRNTAYLGGGIYALESAGQIRGCTLRNNFAGVSAGDVDVIAGQGGGIFGSSIDTVIADCFLADNDSSTSGGGIYIYGSGDADTIIRNCLLLNNQAGRDGGGISNNWGAVVSVENCTLYNNQATGAFGVEGDTGFGGGLYCSYEAQTDINNSIFWDNNGLLGDEIAEGVGFVAGITDKHYCGTVSVSYSDIKGGQAGVIVSDGCPLIWGLGNIEVDPCFVDVAREDFHLKQITAGQLVNSPCLDAGSDLAVLLGMFRYTTSTLGKSDTGTVDMGYHYPIVEYCRKWDLYVDNLVDFRDFAIFASEWVNDSEEAGYGIDDLKEFTYCWLTELTEDISAPIPNPMTWASRPDALTETSVEMRATTAFDSSGQVYYQFERVGGALSDWQTGTYYVAADLVSTGEYCFRVRARDKYYNITEWSEPGCVSDIRDTNSPTPAPTFVSVAPENITREDANTASGQFEWDPVNYHFDWWHRVIVDVTDITDDITPTSELEVRFICGSSKYSSDNIIPMAYRPIRIGYPVAIGGRIPDGSGAASGSFRLTWNGTDRIVYEVYVDATGGSYGRQLGWHVCVYDEAGNSACTDTYLIPQ